MKDSNDYLVVAYKVLMIVHPANIMMQCLFASSCAIMPRSGEKIKVAN